MTAMGEKSRFRNYSTRVKKHTSLTVWYDDSEGELARLFCRINILPSMRELVLEVFQGATEKERAHAEVLLERFRCWGYQVVPAHRWYRHHDEESRRYYWSSDLGWYVDDPLIQLELEMMLDAAASWDEVRVSGG